MKTIVVKRPKENFNLLCKYKIYVGKHKVAELKNGEEKTIEIQTQQLADAIFFRMPAAKSKSIAISAILENEYITVKGNRFLNRTMPLIMGTFPITGLVIFGQYGETAKSISIGLLIMMIAGLIGTLTLWNDRWIDIEKVSHQKNPVKSTVKI